jgi:hypothetical protein
MSEPWGIVLAIGPILLLAVIIYAWSRNRAVAKERGEAGLGTTNAVRGSEAARPDVETDAARARHGDRPN